MTVTSKAVLKPTSPVPRTRTRATRASADASPYVYLVSLRGSSLPALRDGGAGVTYRVSSKRELAEQYRAASEQSVWVASTTCALTSLASQPPVHTSDKRLLLLGDAPEVAQQLYGAFFQYVVAASDTLKLPDFDELTMVLSAPNRRDLFIGGVFDPQADAVLLYRGTLEPLVVPLRWFTNLASGAQMDPADLRVIDHGQTVRLGAFEASADAILYEFDALYRRAAKKRLLHNDSSLGASIRRLRLQRGLSREEFPGLSAKAIARVERNEIARPRSGTLATIARVLKVPVDLLLAY
jgi:hypothetical protein